MTREVSFHFVCSYYYQQYLLQFQGLYVDAIEAGCWLVNMQDWDSKKEDHRLNLSA